MSEFYNPNNQNDKGGAIPQNQYKNGAGSYGGGTVYDEPFPEINIVVDDGPIFCSRCGNPIEPGDAFCSKCGSKTYGSRAENPALQGQPVQQDYSSPVNMQSGMQGSPANAYDNRTRGANFGGIPGGSYPDSSQNFSGAYPNFSNNTQSGQPVINNYYYNNSNNISNMNSGNTYANVNMNGKVKDKYVALPLCIFLGVIGVHRFYEGKIATGLLWLFTGGLFGLGWFIDLLILIFKKGRYYNP